MVTLESLAQTAEEIAGADGKISKEERAALDVFEDYLLQREEYAQEPEGDQLVYQYDGDNGVTTAHLVSEGEIKSITAEFSRRLGMLDRTFRKKTGLTKSDVALLTFATAIHFARITAIDKITEPEKAGQGEKEKGLKKLQEKIFVRHKDDPRLATRDYYAPFTQIVTTPGVPYDATSATRDEINIVAKKPGEKGVNHRFKTLGHDPVLGLVVGTANIMTNTITAVPEGLPVPRTSHVVYDAAYGHPIMGKGAHFELMIQKTIERAKEEPRALVAAFMKQIIHLGTDTFTKAGIPLPAASLVLEPQLVEKLTSFMGGGDLVKAAGISGTEGLVNKAIYVIHGLMLLAEGGEMMLSDGLSRIRTEKIISYSAAIAEGSDILKQFVAKNYKGVDIRHLAGVYKRIYTDMDLIDDLKYEFIHVGLDRLYADEIAR